MAKPFLDCPPSWTRATLEPVPLMGLITVVSTGSTPRTDVEEYWDGDIYWLTPKEVSRSLDGVYVSRTERTITAAGLGNSSSKLLPPNTVMLTKRAPVGAVAVNAVPMATNQGFLNFQCGPKLDPLYLAHWLKVNRPYLDKVANGSTYPELYAGDLFEFEIAVPAVDEQKRMVAVVSALQYIIAQGKALEESAVSVEYLVSVQEQNRRLNRIRDLMLPLLFSGKLDTGRVEAELIEVKYAF